MDKWDFSITIVGLGLIGASFAMALRKLCPKNLWGVDIDQGTLRKAREMGIIDQGYTDAGRVLPDSDLVILAVYPEMTVGFVREHMDDFKSEAVITDTAGIKKKVLEEIRAALRYDLDFIGGHPMAGKEGAGIEYASGDIFQGANYILTPTEINRGENVELLAGILKKIGCGNIARLSPEEHDEIITYVSHLPHVLAMSLINANRHGGEVGSYAGGSFRDATRVALINSSLWTELLLGNRDNLVRQIESLEKEIDALKTAVIQGNNHVLQNIIERANSGRRNIRYE